MIFIPISICSFPLSDIRHPASNIRHPESIPNLQILTSDF